MIDLSNEHLIPIREVPCRLPPRPNGRRIHISAVYRWIQRGVRGVCLEAMRVGGTCYTSVEALQRFADRLSPGNHSDTATPVATTATRRKQIERAEREVEVILGADRARRRRGRGDCAEGSATT